MLSLRSLFLEDSLSGPLGNSVVSLAALRTNFPYMCYLDKEMTEISHLWLNYVQQIWARRCLALTLTGGISMQHTGPSYTVHT